MDVFSEDKLNKIFKCYEGQDSNKIISRESTTLEFKASFSTSAIPRYAKTMAAFANRDGGYIIFGVKNNPRTVIGLKDNTFDEYDDEKFVKNLNEYFSPEIKYDRIQIDYKELKVGILYVFSSEAKHGIAIIRERARHGGFWQVRRPNEVRASHVPVKPL